MGLRRAYKNYRYRKMNQQEFFGLDIRFSGHQYSPAIRELIYHGLYEAHEIKGLQAVIHPTDKVLELGTGLGIITSLSARQAKNGHVLSFEANPDLIEDARNLVRLNGISNVEIRHGVLVKDPTEAEQTFHLAKSFAESSLRPMSHAVSTITVPTHDLVAVQADFQPDVLICDIEGAEADLLPQVDLATIRAAVIELHPHVLSAGEVAGIYDHFIANQLYPKIEHCGGTVVVFERLEP
ncbi:FkbM family methyltransferase [Yoonia sp.]|uniref:FkbM family methyltransferase n=1 Tax=Yoonia sp. TaxID=2212373 RepID=UPI001A08A41E|nr:FkbM family methyltransferase [Yoonia sp.]MBE0412924.1 FkbM family methyltransferase [Yoonia sp.]